MELSELRKTPHLSASSINDYVECGLLYKFGKIDKIPIDYKSDNLIFGSVIHMVLGEYYTGKMMGEKTALKALQECFEVSWSDAAEDNEEIQYSKNNTFESLLLMGKELLSAWYHALPDDNYKVIGIEEAFSVKLPGIEIPLIGAMDLVEEDSNTIIITDFKTSARSYSLDEVDKNMQLLLYQVAAKLNGYVDRDILLRLDVLVKTKTPKFEQYWTTRSEVDERRLVKKIHTVWNGIQNGVFIPNDQSWRCKTCMFKIACDEWFERRAA
jgi:putative RecB family exonuclease